MLLSGSGSTKRLLSRLVKLCAAALVVVSVVFYLASRTPSQSTSQPLHQQSHASWSGWSRLEHFFIFGDSYSDVFFDVNGTQPHPENPFGNPWTAPEVNGMSPWPTFMSTLYNPTFLRTYILAKGGSVVDQHLHWLPDIPGMDPQWNKGKSLVEQVRDKFEKIYVSRPNFAQWNEYSTLFAFFFGVNDIMIPTLNGTIHTPLPETFAVYRAQVDKVYRHGARNFLFFNVPPFTRASELRNREGNTIAWADIADWNYRLAEMRSEFAAEHPDTVTYLFDTFSMYNSVIEDPTSQPETAGLRNVTDTCEYYKWGTFSRDQFNEPCIYPVNQYLWLGNGHATYSVHNATARLVVEDCFSESEPKGFCS